MHRAQRLSVAFELSTLSQVGLYVSSLLNICGTIPKSDPDSCSHHSSINEVICHGIPDQRKLQEGDIVNIGTSRRTHGDLDSSSPQDVTLYYDGEAS
jgi:hypothetical protein